MIENHAFPLSVNVKWEYWNKMTRVDYNDVNIFKGYFGLIFMSSLVTLRIRTRRYIVSLFACDILLATCLTCVSSYVIMCGTITSQLSFQNSSFFFFPIGIVLMLCFLTKIFRWAIRTFLYVCAVHVITPLYTNCFEVICKILRLLTCIDVFPLTWAVC